MSFDATHVTASASTWFSANIEYAGRARAEFLDPKGAIEGSVQLRFNENGEAYAKMEIEHVESDQPLEFGLQQLFSGTTPVRTGNQVRFSFGGGHNPCTELTLITAVGNFMSAEQVHYDWEIGEYSYLTFYLFRSRFDTVEHGPARYWVLPLSNFISELRQCHPDLDRHPLRIYPTPAIPSDLAGEDALNVSLIANAMNQLAIFEFNGGFGFIEHLPDYADRKSRLVTGRERNLITSVMVGEVGTNPIEFDDLTQWFPYDYLRLLSLATGTVVGAPWIEFRDSEAKLVRRLHQSLGGSAYAEGHAMLREEIHGGTGRLLTNASMSPHWNTSYLRVSLKHLVEGGLHNRTMEDNLDDLCRGFECLCESHNLAKQHLLQTLDPSNQSLVGAVLRTAEQDIRAAAKTAAASGNHVAVRLLNKIAGRISNSANVDRDFGLAVTDLLKLFSLPDADIVDAYYQARPRADGIRTWSEVLSHYRGAVIHTGYFDFRGGAHDIDDTLTIRNHLHDILVRILLRMLGYDGSYQPTTTPMTTDERIDWVKANTPARRLGY